MSEKYVTSCYWAVVTISTVGYGDITPTNVDEVLANIPLVFVGVSLYSYIISRMTLIFTEVGGGNKNQTVKAIDKFVQKSKIDD